jgi:L-rhamnose mutarotase
MGLLRIAACIVILVTALPGAGHSTPSNCIVPSKNKFIMQKRYCMALDLRKDSSLIAQYKHVHTKAGIWPEIPRGIKEVGITDMEIYLWDNRMFMILETPLSWDYDSEMAKLGTLERQPEWGDFVWQFQQLLPWSKNGEKWMQMDKVFQLNQSIVAQETAKTGYTEPVYSHPTQRFCSTLDLKDNPDLIKQYRYYHSPEGHWPEIAKGIRSVGILDMQIYLIGNRMFMVAETKPGFNWNEQMHQLSTLEKQKDWETLMQKFQQPLPGITEVKWELMENVFDLNRDF